MCNLTSFLMIYSYLKIYYRKMLRNPYHTISSILLPEAMQKKSLYYSWTAALTHNHKIYAYFHKNCLLFFPEHFLIKLCMHLVTTTMKKTHLSNVKNTYLYVVMIYKKRIIKFKSFNSRLERWIEVANGDKLINT